MATCVVIVLLVYYKSLGWDFVHVCVDSDRDLLIMNNVKIKKQNIYFIGNQQIFVWRRFKQSLFLLITGVTPQCVNSWYKFGEAIKCMRSQQCL